MARFCLLTCALLLTGCATDRPIDFACGNINQFRVRVSPTPLDNTESAPVRTLADDLAPATTEEAGAPRPKTYLILSGGGEWGAFGAGLLAGWSRSGGGPARPARFDVVTGVSTGALQATYAFLGRERDQALLDAYRITSERQLLRQNGSLFFLRHASLADIAPLRRYVEERVGPLLDEVAAAARADPDRRLYVGAVDALDGQLYAFNLTRIATDLSGSQRLACYAGALISSAAEPVIFRQVSIDGRPYFDGGVRQSVFVLEVEAQIAEQRARARDLAPGTAFIVMNGTTGAAQISQLPAKLLPTLNRVRQLTFNQIEQTSVFNAAAKLPNMQSWFASADGHDCDALRSEGAIFSPPFMACLSAYGERQFSGAGTNWRPISTSVGASRPR